MATPIANTPELTYNSIGRLNAQLKTVTQPKTELTGDSEMICSSLLLCDLKRFTLSAAMGKINAVKGVYTNN